MERIGVVGLGRMGLPIAIKLKKAGFDMSVTDICEDRMDLAKAADLRLALSVEDLVDDCTLLLTVLPSATAVHNLMVGERGVLPKLKKGTLWVDLTSNNDPTAAAVLGDIVSAQGIGIVAAPIEGGPKRAVAGTLRFFVAGETGVVERTKPFLSAIAPEGDIQVVGTRFQEGFAIKLIVNLLWFGQVAAVTETLLLAKRLGIAADTMQNVLSNSAAESAFIRQHLPLLLEGDYMAHFGLDSCVHQLRTLSALASSFGTPFQLSNSVVQLYEKALDEFGRIDGELLVAKLLEQIAGQELRR